MTDGCDGSFPAGLANIYARDLPEHIADAIDRVGSSLRRENKLEDSAPPVRLHVQCLTTALDVFEQCLHLPVILLICCDCDSQK